MTREQFFKFCTEHKAVSISPDGMSGLTIEFDNGEIIEACADTNYGLSVIEYRASKEWEATHNPPGEKINFRDLVHAFQSSTPDIKLFNKQTHTLCQ